MFTHSKPQNPAIGRGLLTVLVGTAMQYAAVAQAHHEQACSHEPDSYEFKTLVRNDAFTDHDAAVGAFLDRFEAIVGNEAIAGTGVRFEREVESRQREVRFLDTSDGLLQQHGWIFRVRTQMNKKCEPSDFASCKPRKAAVTLKQRFGAGINGRLQHMEPLAPAKTFADEELLTDSKFEVDYGWLPGSGGREVVAKRSLSAGIESEGLKQRDQLRTYATIGDVTDLYPKVDWGDLANHAATPIASGCPIASTKTKAGKLIFPGGVECKASFTFWREQTDDTPLASEFSFGCKAGGGFDDAAHDRAKAIFKALLADDTIEPCPNTKTAIARRCSAACP